MDAVDSDADTAVKAFFTALAAWLRRSGRRKLVCVVDQAPLFGGAVVHVVDVGTQRFVVATSANAICLLAQFDGATQGAPV